MDQRQRYQPRRESNQDRTKRENRTTHGWCSHDSGGQQGRFHVRERYYQVGAYPVELTARRLRQNQHSKNVNEFVLWLSNEKNGFKQLLNSTITDMKVIETLFSSIDMIIDPLVPGEILLNLLYLIENSKFLSQSFPYYLTTVLQWEEITDSHVIECLKNALKLFLELMTRMPSSYINVNTCLNMLSEAKKKHVHMTAFEELEKNFKEAVDLRDKLLQRQLKNRGQKEKTGPPNDFREYGIFPTLDDIYPVHEPYLRRIKAKGTYNDLDHYLDVQYRLLREDFVSPLRNGIQEYTNMSNTSGKKRYQDIRVYHKVQIRTPLCGESGILHDIQFDISKLRRINWTHSKRLIYGSLLCLSDDGFQTMIFATVIDRTEENLREGLIRVRFEHSHDDIAEMSFDREFTMIETSAYFEAYKHVLVALQKIQPSFPFQQYILKCEKKIQPPEYLQITENDNYDLKPFINDGTKIDGMADYESKFRILDDETWPTSEEMDLDSSQYKALQMALRNEFVIIQGPPGTGKTYLGLKIVEILLHNKKIWSNLMIEERIAMRHNHSPILIVCYTNHALDQFLEGISVFHGEGLVRIGGRSKNENLERFHISKLKNEMKVGKNFPSELHRRKCELLTEIEEAEKRIHETAAAIQVSYEGILVEDLLKCHIGRRLWKNLVKKAPQKPIVENGFYVVEWLGLSRQPPKGYRVGISGVLDDEQKNEGDETGVTLGITDEAKEIQDERKVSSIFSEDDTLTGCRKTALRKIKLHLQDSGLKYEQKKFWRDHNQDQVCSRREYLEAGLKSDNVMSEQDAVRVWNLWTLSYVDRWKLYRLWLRKYRNEKKKLIRATEKRFESLTKQMVEIRMEEDIAIMKDATVIAMTTSGAARYQNALQRISPRIVVVEEAAEVLEAHIIANLSDGCQHLILIGDHKQLRPNPNVYKLATRYNLEVSFFERMINNGITYQCLQLQHRMRPEIAELISDIYPELQNHPCVEEYERVGGITKNLFFVDHKELESTDEELMSKSNKHEAEFVVGLCKYLMDQGYDGEDITILTMYTGQVLVLKKQMPRDKFHGVRLCSVDNYQGEENLIIILSLVRSNEENKIGFLRIENRVCVALSRAKVGFFAIGNLDLLANNSSLWRKLKVRMEEKGNIGPYLELYCQNHPKDQHICAKTGDDFNRAPNGGCMKICESRLDCGHACVEFCHIAECSTFKCKKKCMRICPGGHQSCPNHCYEECPPCKVPVEKTSPNCKHKQKVECHEEEWDCTTPIRCSLFLECGHTPDKMIFCQDRHIYKCMEPCKTICPNDHPCPKPCHEDCGDCSEPIEKVIPKCYHSQLVPCHLDPSLFKCRSQCDKTLECGHCCPKLCHESCISKYNCKEVCHLELDCGHEADVPCNEKRHHMCEKMVEHTIECGHPQQVKCYMLKELKVQLKYIKCKAPCERTLKCGHRCKKLCYEFCESEGLSHSLYRTYRCGTTVLCQERCLKKCANGHRCTGKCSEECRPCNVLTVKEIPKCGHKQKMKCRLDPSQALCETKCKTHLDCGHECPMLCHILSKGTRIICSKPCAFKLPCGHICGGTCGRCHQGNVHAPCKAYCNRLLPCGHKCMKPCGCTDCPPCRQSCRQRCEHKRCPRSCSDPCEPCNARCGISCKHGLCKNTCSKRCDNPKCTQHCFRKFTCRKCSKKQSCIGVCGEKCPFKCKVCDHKEISAALFGKKLSKESRFILLEDCNHIIEMEYLDSHMATDDNGNSIIKAKLCPKCNEPIVRSRRYKHEITDILRAANSMHQKKILLTNNVFMKVEDEVTKVIEHLAEVDREKYSLLENTLKISKDKNEVDIDKLRAILIQATIVTSLIELREEQCLKNPNDQQTDKINTKQLECIDAYINEILSPRRVVSSFELKQFKDEYRRLSKSLKGNPENVPNSMLPTSIPKMMSLAGKFLQRTVEDLPKVDVDTLVIDNHERQSDDVWMFCYKGHVWKSSDDVIVCSTCNAEGTTFVKKIPTVNALKLSQAKMDGADKYNTRTDTKREQLHKDGASSSVTVPGEMVGIGARAKTYSSPHHGNKDVQRQHSGSQGNVEKHPRQQEFKGQGHSQQSRRRDNQHNRSDSGKNKPLIENAKEDNADSVNQRQQKAKKATQPRESTGQSKKKRQKKKKN